MFRKNAGCSIKPVVNQIRYSNGHTQPDVADFCKSEDIVVAAYSPLATGKILHHPQLRVLAKRSGKSIAQLCIRRVFQKCIGPLPKSTNFKRIRENSDRAWKSAVRTSGCSIGLATPRTFVSTKRPSSGRRWLVVAASPARRPTGRQDMKGEAVEGAIRRPGRADARILATKVRMASRSTVHLQWLDNRCDQVERIRPFTPSGKKPPASTPRAGLP